MGVDQRRVPGGRRRFGSLDPVGIESELGARPRTESDLDRVVDWIRDAEDLFLFSGNRLRWPLSADQLRTLTETHGLTAFAVVSSSSELVAHFDLAVDLDERIARLGRVIVDPALRGRGLARLVVELAIEQAGRAGADRILLGVIATHEPAVRAYSRAGFTPLPAGSRSDGIIVMQRELSTPDERGRGSVGCAT